MAQKGISKAAGGKLQQPPARRIVATPQPGGGGALPAPPPTPPIVTPLPGSHEPANGVHPLMISSLPAIASGADVYSRQFYRGPQIPFRRYLPVSLS
jgi:hypothetical protein